MSIDPGTCTFRPFRADDLPLLHRWVNATHAKRWFGNGRTTGDLSSEYLPYIRGEVPIRVFVVLYEELPIGMVEWEHMVDFPDFARAYGVTEPGVANCDILIGDPAFVGRGLGASLVTKFLREIVFADPRIHTCVLDPEPDNRAAIRAYEKAGFVHVRDLDDDGQGNAVYLMELRRSP